MNKRWMTLLLVPIAFVLMGSTCNDDHPKNSAQDRSQQLTEQYQRQLEDAVPYPLDAMHDSVERRNLKERLLRFNKPDKIGYVYLLSDTGQVVSFYTIKGKISSTQSQLTASQTDRCHYHYEQGCEVTEAPGDDGSYGPNEDGVFFFTTEGVLVQWNGKFIYADAPLKVTTAPIIVETPGAKPTSVAGG